MVETRDLFARKHHHGPRIKRAINKIFNDLLRVARLHNFKFVARRTSELAEAGGDAIHDIIHLELRSGGRHDADVRFEKRFCDLRLERFHHLFIHHTLAFFLRLFVAGLWIEYFKGIFKRYRKTTAENFLRRLALFQKLEIFPNRF